MGYGEICQYQFFAVSLRGNNSLINITMDFPPNYVILDADRFATAEPREPGALGAEVLAQVRSTGRIADHFRVTLGGSRIFDVSAPLAAMIQGVPATWQFRFQVWLRDIEIRRNMVSTAWLNVHAQLAARKAWITDQAGVQIQHKTALEEIQDKHATFRFIMVIGDCSNLELMLQALPASKETLTGKPAFRGLILLIEPRCAHAQGSSSAASPLAIYGRPMGDYNILRGPLLSEKTAVETYINMLPRPYASK
jgi:hypothetical protein